MNDCNAKDAVELSPQIIDKDQPYSCFYCDCDNEPLIQFGHEASTSEEWESRERMVSPEDANNVEVCEKCLLRALGLFGERVNPFKNVDLTVVHKYPHTQE